MYALGITYVIGTIVTGFIGLVLFVAWELFAKLEEPLMPMQLFKNGGWNAATVFSGVGASVYYAMAII